MWRFLGVPARADSGNSDPPLSSQEPQQPDLPSQASTLNTDSPSTDTASSQPSTSAPSEAAPAEAAAQPEKKPKKKPRQWEPLQMPSPMQIVQEDIMNNCAVKGVFSGVMGGLAGFAFGLFSASIENAGGGPMSDMSDIRERSSRVVIKEMYQNMKTKSLSFARGFASFGALYSFNECLIEKYRARHDKVNPVLAGCATGGMMAYQAGPGAMCIGCVTVGAFSLAIEHFLESHD